MRLREVGKRGEEIRDLPGIKYPIIYRREIYGREKYVL
jgi:ribosomal protein S12